MSTSKTDQLKEFEAIRAYKPPIADFAITYAINPFEWLPGYELREIGRGETPFDAYENAKSLLAELVDISSLPNSLPASVQITVEQLQKYNSSFHFVTIWYKVEGYDFP